MQALARAGSARTTHENAERVAQDLARRIHSELATGSDDGFRQNFETANLSQRDAEINFLANKKRLIQSARRVEIFARREEERARAEVQSEIERAERFQKDS